MCSPHQQNIGLQKDLQYQHRIILAEEAYHKQCYKKNWYVKGDRNTNFFHQSIIKRAKRNTITHLSEPDGSFSTTQEQLALTTNVYFKSIFRSQTNGDAGIRLHGWSQDLQRTGGINEDAYPRSIPN